MSCYCRRRRLIQAVAGDGMGSVLPATTGSSCCWWRWGCVMLALGGFAALPATGRYSCCRRGRLPGEACRADRGGRDRTPGRQRLCAATPRCRDSLEGKIDNMSSFVYFNQFDWFDLTQIISPADRRSKGLASSSAIYRRITSLAVCRRIASSSMVCRGIASSRTSSLNGVRQRCGRARPRCGDPLEEQLLPKLQTPREPPEDQPGRITPGRITGRSRGRARPSCCAATRRRRSFP